MRPNLTLTLGFRDEFSTGWNEAYGRASNYTYPNGVISSQPNVGNSLFTVNRAKFLPQPRIGLAWSPLGSKTVVRAGFGMYNDLQDALGYRADQNAPFNPTYTIASGSIANLHLPINPSGTARRECAARAGRSSAGHVHADGHYVFAASRAGTISEHVA